MNILASIRRTISLVVIILIISNLQAQKIATKKIKEDPFHFDNFILLQNGEKSFIISKYKTTNKEYLCFLQWTYKVFAKDYSILYKAILPDTTKYPDIFDPKKWNMPVRGISKKQAQAFCLWRSDRLNEYILIREGILKKDYKQQNAENFNTEAYLSQLYEGMVRNDILDKYTNEPRKVNISDHILLPCFYIASKNEIKTCDSLVKLKSIECKHKIKSDLDTWMLNELERSINVNDNSPLNHFKSKLTGIDLTGKQKIKRFIRKYQKELAAKNIEFDMDNTIVSIKDFRTFNLHKYKSDIHYYKLIADSNAEPFKTYSPMIEKDKLGRMNFIYIADNYDGTPICVNKSIFEDNTDADISKAGFYCTMNIPYRLYWKLQEFILSNSSKLYLY